MAEGGEQVGAVASEVCCKEVEGAPMVLCYFALCDKREIRGSDKVSACWSNQVVVCIDP